MSPPARSPEPRRRRQRKRTTKESGQDRPPAFFIDRSLGRKHLAGALTELGLTVHTMASVYGEQNAQELEDERWLADVGRHDWIVHCLTTGPAYRLLAAGRSSLRLCAAAADLRASCIWAAFLTV